MTEAAIIRVAKIICDFVGTEEWSDQSRPRYVLCAFDIIRELKNVSAGAIIAGSDVYFEEAQNAETLVDATNAAWQAILGFIAVEK